jgi:hydrogenase nickel incorporation protein HypA/HybF
MHEWALADAVLEATASALAGRDPSCLRSVTVVIGELQAIDRGIFDFALSSLLLERPFRGAAYTLETEAAVLRCRVCQREWGLEQSPELTPESREAIHFLPEAAHAFIRCPSCGSPDYGVTKGRGVGIASIGILESCI